MNIIRHFITNSFYLKNRNLHCFLVDGLEFYSPKLSFDIVHSWKYLCKRFKKMTVIFKNVSVIGVICTKIYLHLITFWALFNHFLCGENCNLLKYVGIFLFSFKNQIFLQSELIQGHFNNNNKKNPQCLDFNSGDNVEHLELQCLESVTILNFEVLVHCRPNLCICFIAISVLCSL